jgi:hypothetical protein
MTRRAPVKIVRDQLVLGPVRVEFQRTLRIPETGLHPLLPWPVSLHSSVTRHARGLPRLGRSRAMDQCEGKSLWPVHQTFSAFPARKVLFGAASWMEHLIGDPQNYVALPDQPWLDGINAGDGFIRQFVAVPLGSGVTVEGQVTGQETHGGVQLRAVGLTRQALAEWRAAQTLRSESCADLPVGAPPAAAPAHTGAPSPAAGSGPHPPPHRGPGTCRPGWSGGPGLRPDGWLYGCVGVWV